VPFDNNQAGSDNRMGKVKPKFSGFFGSTQSVKAFSQIRGYSSIAYINDQCIMDILLVAFPNLPYLPPIISPA
jgi:hypothetical protein